MCYEDVIYSIIFENWLMLYITCSGGGPIHARVPIQAHPQFS